MQRIETFLVLNQEATVQYETFDSDIDEDVQSQLLQNEIETPIQMPTKPTQLPSFVNFEIQQQPKPNVKFYTSALTAFDSNQFYSLSSKGIKRYSSLVASTVSSDNSDFAHEALNRFGEAWRFGFVFFNNKGVLQ